MNDLRKGYFNSLFEHGADGNYKNDIKSEILQLESEQFGILYKYCNINTAINILKSNGVLLQPPDDFNDPYDCLNGIDIWSHQLQFWPDDADMNSLSNLLNKIPNKFYVPKYKVLRTLRSSYCFAISCFTTCYKNHLMWSHYADRHRGVCLEFNVYDNYDDLHPCHYTDIMPNLDWQSKNLYLSLIKCSAWRYENEWRLVKKTIRPVMRMFGSLTSQIYNQIHSYKRYSKADREEWGSLCANMHNDLQKNYDRERLVPMRLNKIYLGLRHDHNYSNTTLGDQCKKIISYSDQSNIPIHRIVAKKNSFNLYSVPL